jgi:hypothetical protein
MKTQDKPMYTLAEVEPLIIDEWHIWSQANNSRQGVDMLLFYGYLQKEKNHLLSFRCNGDKWQRVHGWLQNHEDKRVGIRGE